MAKYSLTHLFLHSLIHSILIDLYVPGAVLDAGNITSEQIRKKKKSCLHGIYTSVGVTDNERSNLLSQAAISLLKRTKGAFKGWWGQGTPWLEWPGKLSLRTSEQRPGQSEGSAVHIFRNKSVLGRRKSSEKGPGVGAGLMARTT